MGHTGVLFDYEVRQQRLLQVRPLLLAASAAATRALPLAMTSGIGHPVHQHFWGH